MPQFPQHVQGRPNARSGAGESKLMPSLGVEADATTREDVAATASLQVLAPYDKPEPMEPPIGSSFAIDEDAFASYIARRVARGRPSADTVRGYLSDARQFLTWMIKSHLRPELLNEEAIEHYRASLVARGLRAATIARRLVVVRALLEAWVREERANGRIVSNPAQDVEPPVDRQSPEERIRWLSLAQLSELLEAPTHYEIEEPARAARDRLLLALLALHGLRLVEAHRLDEEDILRRGSTVILRVRGKRHDRDVYLRSDTIPLLECWLALRDREPVLRQRRIQLERQQQGKWGADRAMEGMDRQGGIPLFTSFSVQNQGARITRRGLHMIVTGYLRAIGAKSAHDQRGITPHTLRHTFATQALAAGASMEQLQDQGGWMKPETVRRYAHVLDRVGQNPSERIPLTLKTPDGSLGNEESKP
jgi:site-specific recombinase XerD